MQYRINTSHQRAYGSRSRQWQQSRIGPGTCKRFPATRSRHDSLVNESFVLRRLSSDAPEALLANQHERLTIDGSFGEAVGEHG